jgi:hypothetical protein
VPAAITSAWIRGTMLSTSGYVAAVSNAAASPAVRAAIQEAVTTQVDAALRHDGGVLPGPLRTGLADLAGKGVSEVMASSAFQRLWAAANQLAHSQLISVLNGNSTLVSATGGHVVLNLIPLVNNVLHTVAGTPVRHDRRRHHRAARQHHPRRRRTLLHMTIGGTLTLLLVLTVISWLQSSLIAPADRAIGR